MLIKVISSKFPEGYMERKTLETAEGIKAEKGCDNKSWMKTLLRL